MIVLPCVWAALVYSALVSGSSIPSSSNADNFELLILHNNDMHARFEQTSQLSGVCTTSDREAGKCYGGFPRVAHVVKEARAAAASGQGPPVLYLNAGDTYTGTAWFTIYKWKIAAEFINALQPDAVSLGNHELDNGVSGLTPFIKNLTCPVLAANLVLLKEPTLIAERNLRNSVVLNINGTKIGIIGYLTPETKILTMKNNIDYIDETIAIKKEVQKLKKEGVKIFIALGHSGFTKDLEIAKQVEDIDLVIGGHTNTFLWNGSSPDVEKPEGPYPTMVRQKTGRLVPAVQAYAYTKYLGKLHLIINSDGEIVSMDGNPLLLDSSVPQDIDVLQLVNSYKSEVLNVTDTVVGNSSVMLDGHTCRVNECNMGNLISDAMVAKYAAEYTGEGWTDAPIAVIQGGGIRASISRATLPIVITKGDLMTVLPFEGNLVKMTINGTNILWMLEHSVEFYSTVSAPGKFLQISGLMVEYDFKMKPGKRVRQVYIRCGKCNIPEYKLLNKTEVYNILMPAFLSTGGDGYSVFINLPSTPLPYGDLESTTEYIQKHSPISPFIERRVIMHNMNAASSSSLSLAIGILALILFLF